MWTCCQFNSVHLKSQLSTTFFFVFVLAINLISPYHRRGSKSEIDSILYWIGDTRYGWGRYEGYFVLLKHSKNPKPLRNDNTQCWWRWGEILQRTMSATTTMGTHFTVSRSVFFSLPELKEIYAHSCVIYAFFLFFMSFHLQDWGLERKIHGFEVTSSSLSELMEDGGNGWKKIISCLILHFEGKEQRDGGFSRFSSLIQSLEAFELLCVNVINSFSHSATSERKFMKLYSSWTMRI